MVALSVTNFSPFRHPAPCHGPRLGPRSGSRAGLLSALWLASLLGLLASGCSWLPKVHVVSDPLSKEEHLRLAMTYEKDGELDIAEREYRAAFPLGAAYLGLGNVLYQKGEVDDALPFYRRAWQFEKIPAAANNLAWVLLMEGGSLEEAKEMATLAVGRAEEEGLDQAVIDSFKGTLSQIDQAIKASGRRAERERDG